MAEERWSVALAVKESSRVPSCVNGAFDRSSENYSLEARGTANGYTTNICGTVGFDLDGT